MWACVVNDAQYEKLPNLKFEFIANSNGETKILEMPPQSYMKRASPEISWLLLSPWEFQGMGGQPGEEYWVLGA